MAPKEYTIDPATTTIADLLDIASSIDSGTLTIKGELPDSTSQWAIIAIFGPHSSSSIDIIEEWAATNSALDEAEAAIDSIPLPTTKPALGN